MSDKAKAAAKQFLSVLTPLFGEADRPLITEKLEGNEAALIKLGEGVLRQEEFSSKMAEAAQIQTKAQAWHQSLDAWHVNLRKELKEAGFDGADISSILQAVKTKMAALKANPNPAGPAGGGDPMELTEEKVNQIVAAAVASVKPAAAIDYTPRIDEAMALAAHLPKLALSHYKKYGKELDTEALVAHARTTGQPIDKGGYESFVKADIDAFNQAEQAKVIADAEARGEARGRAAASDTAPPWPVGGEPGTVGPNGEPTTLSGITRRKVEDPKPGPTTNAGGVAAAVEMYNKLTAARGVTG